jgi:hypothetical protein
MYFLEHQNRLSGFAEPPQPTLAQAKAAIMAALQLNPVGGYIINTPPRQALEAAFALVPPCSALELGMELNRKETPLAKLFQYRLATPTRAAMRNILSKKMDECTSKTDLLQEARRTLCPMMKEMETKVAEICRIRGNDSDLCKQDRSQLLALQEKLRRAGINCP